MYCGDRPESQKIRNDIDIYVDKNFGFCWRKPGPGKEAVSKQIFKQWLVDGDFASLIDFVYEAFKGLGVSEKVTVWTNNKMLASLPNSYRFLLTDEKFVEQLIRDNDRHVCLTAFESKAVFWFAIWEPERELILKEQKSQVWNSDEMQNWLRRILTRYYDWCEKGFQFAWLDSRAWPEELY